MVQAGDGRQALMRRLDETFREVRKLIHAEWNKHNVHGLGMTHGRLLIILAESGPQKASALAEQLSITSGGVTGIADRLIELGYIERERGTEDRRVVLLKLTEKGRETIELISSIRKKVMMKLYRGMTEEDMERAIAIFEQMNRNMSAEETEQS